MTKSEAIKAMQEGHKVSHYYFTDDEWITMENGLIVTEDGYKHKPEEFWSYRKGPTWEDDYKFVFPK